LRAASYSQRKRRPLLGADLVSRLDWVLLGACAAIAVIGIVMIYSASHNESPDDPFYFVKRQAVSTVVAVGVVLLILRTDYRKLRDYSLLIYVITLGMLLVVKTPLGHSANGAQSWIPLLFGFRLEPSEPAKFGLIVALAGYVNEHRGDIDPWRLTVILSLALTPIALVYLQPDFGTAMVLMVILVGLLAVAGVRARYLVVLAMLALTGVYAVASLGILKQYQLDRLTTVVNSDPSGAGYTVDQSVRTIATGQLFGQGLFDGPQTGGGYVPEQQTDFIFTAVAEELGFMGASLLLALFAIVMWRTWRTARLSRDYYGTLVCAGVLAMFAFMIFENVGMTMGIMPVTGIPLPFTSYGGSSLVTCSACVAVVANVYANRFS
jgi:rod shape determining protein RodA